MTIKSQGGIFGRNPTFNDVEVDGTLTVGGNAVPAANTILVDGDIGSTVQAYDADTAKRDTAQTFSGIQSFSNQVNISGGIVSGANNTLTISNGSGQSQLWALGDGSTQGSFLIVQALNNLTNSRQLLGFDTSGNATFYSGNIAVANGNGIDFSATAGTGTSELFSDYEEGLWTPVLVGSSSAGTATFVSGPNGTYTKIGNQVTVYFSWDISAHTGTGALRVNGLPFTASSATAIGSIMDGNYTYPASRTKLVPYAVGAVIRFYGVGSGVGYTENTLDVVHQMNGTMTYTV